MTDPQPITMRDGSVVFDPRLDALFHQDERSRDFPIAELIPQDIKSHLWSCPLNFDQKLRGSCVPHSGAHDLAAYPAACVGMTPDFILDWMVDCQRNDYWEGEYPAYDGTSMLALGVTGKRRGYWDEYRWCFTEEDLLRTLSNAGPVLLATEWYEGMMNARMSGRVVPEGEKFGRHAFLCNGWRYSPPPGESGYYWLRCVQSWYKGWSHLPLNQFYIKLSDYTAKLMGSADMMVPVRRHKLAF